jgi:hypothetical protein
VKICVDRLQSTFLCGRVEQFSWKKMKTEEDEASQQPLSRIVGGERKKIYEYNIEWEVNSASQCIGKNCSLPREWKREGKLLWCSFYDFFKIFPKM